MIKIMESFDNTEKNITQGINQDIKKSSIEDDNVINNDDHNASTSPLLQEKKSGIFNGVVNILKSTRDSVVDCFKFFSSIFSFESLFATGNISGQYKLNNDSNRKITVHSVELTKITKIDHGELPPQNNLHNVEVKNKKETNMSSGKVI